MYVLIDEGHHAGNNQRLAVALKQFASAGNTVILATATAFRTEGTMLELAGCKQVLRTFSKHMEEGFGPKCVKSEVLAYIANETKNEIFCGRQSPSDSKDADALVASLLTAWNARGRPKVIISVPSNYHSKKIVPAIQRAFANDGAKVLNAYGASEVKQQEILGTLAAEANKCWRDSEIDVIVGCNRVQEGMDWKHCCEVFCIGAPGAATKIIQLLGRATRMKDETCPERFRLDASIVFFVPSLDGTLSRLPTWHLERVLIVCGILEEASNGILWKILDRINKIYGTGKRVACRERTLFDQERLAVNVAFSKAIIRLAERGNENPTVERIVSEMMDFDSTLDEESLRLVVIGKLNRSSVACMDAITREMQKWPSKEFLQSLRELVAAFGKENLVSSNWDPLVIRKHSTHSIRLGSEDIKRHGKSVVRLSGAATNDMGTAQKLSREMFASRTKSAKAIVS